MWTQIWLVTTRERTKKAEDKKGEYNYLLKQDKCEAHIVSPLPRAKRTRRVDTSAVKDNLKTFNPRPSKRFCGVHRLSRARLPYDGFVLPYTY